MRVKRHIAGRQVDPIGLGCMNLSHAYGHPLNLNQAADLLAHALDLGIEHFDTAALYGFGRNEDLLGDILSPYRKRIFLASKCGARGVDGKRVIDGRPETLKDTCEGALKRLRTDHIDLYYLHRWDKQVPLEDSVGALAELKQAGKIGAIGLSEVSAATLLRANDVHPIAAVQSEYSLWTRNPEIAVLEACRKINAAFVAFSPLGRGFLTGAIKNLDFAPGDLRETMPRFMEPNFSHNRKTLEALRVLAADSGLSPTQLSLSWLLSRGDHVHIIPGTTSKRHLEENVRVPTAEAYILKAATAIFSSQAIHGDRYAPAARAEIDTEAFPDKSA